MREFGTEYQLSRSEAELAGVAARQYGVVSRAQALEAGLSDTQVVWRLRRGLWVRVHGGVYRLAGVARSWRGDLMAACLALGSTAVVSHRAAAALWQLDGFGEGRVEVTVAGTGERRLKGVVVHRSRSLPVGDRGEVDALPVTRAARTLIDLAAVTTPDLLEAALDSALREGKTSVGNLERRLRALGTRGRAGAEVLGELLEQRRRRRPADSQRENQVAHLLVANGLPEPVRQFELRDDDGVLVARFDLAYPEVRIAIEFDSYRHHFGRQAWRRDQSRHNQATARGWLVFHLTEGGGVGHVAQAYRHRTAA